MNLTPQKSHTPPAEPPKADRQTRDRTEFYQGIRIYAFAGTLVLLFVIGLLLFLRPSVSESEKRELAKFPTPTWDSFISGEFFSDINTWYADTYPGREALIGLNNAIRELFGIRTVQLIPSAPDPSGPSQDPTSPGGTDTDPDSSAPPIEKLGSVYLKGDTAYEVYGHHAENAQRYAALIAQAGEQLAGIADVYAMLVPLSASVSLTESELQAIGSSDARSAIDAMFAAMGDRVNPVEIYDTLRAHKNEYLYFRTDHHWTALGAYYAYTCFCRAAGMDAMSLSDWTKYEFGGFLGTLYAEAGQPQALKGKPDTVQAWVPNATNDIYITDRDGQRLRYRGGIVRTDTDSFYQNAASKYNCFIMGDHPLAYIHNETRSDGSSIVVVKESFGNALVPFLVDHYEYVYVIDYRYYTAMSLSEFVVANGVDTVLFINNLTATSAAVRINELTRLLGN